MNNLKNNDEKIFFEIKKRSSNCWRRNLIGHVTDSTLHGHADAVCLGPRRSGQGSSLDINCNQVPNNSPLAHFPINY